MHDPTIFLTNKVITLYNVFSFVPSALSVMSIHIETIPNKRGRDTILMRRATRQGQRIVKTTIANLTDFPPHIVASFDTILRGGVAVNRLEEVFEVKRSLPHGHVCAILACCHSIGLPRLLGRQPSRMRQLALAAIVARILAPASKLATARSLSPATASSSLGPALGLGAVSGNELLDMLDWLHQRQPWISRSLARRHLGDGTTLLYDLSSSWFEGDRCPLAAFGYSRDGKRSKKQVVYGLLCSSDGCPIDIEVFNGNTADPATVAAQVQKIKQRFSLHRVALVGDRGMLTSARIRDDLHPAGLHWISALTSRSIRKLVRATDQQPAVVQPQQIEDEAVIEVVHPDFPGERLVVCLNPRLRDERRRRREQLLLATERILTDIASAVDRGSLRGREQIQHRLGRQANRNKVEKHFQIKVADDRLTWQRNLHKIESEQQLDGVYVIRTNLAEHDITTDDIVAGYKNLTRVERAFRCLKSDLKVRPFHVWTPAHLRGHLFLCLLAYHVEWHLRRCLAPLLFEDHDRATARQQRSNPVAAAVTSPAAQHKASSKQTPDKLPVHSFATLFQDLATLTLMWCSVPGHPEMGVPITASPTPVQQKALDLLNADPGRFVPSAMTG